MGVLAEPHREAGSQKAHASLGAGSRWISLSGQLWKELSPIKERAEFKYWSEVEKLLLKNKLKPLAELYEALS